MKSTWSRSFTCWFSATHAHAHTYTHIDSDQGRQLNVDYLIKNLQCHTVAQHAERDNSWHCHPQKWSHIRLYDFDIYEHKWSFCSDFWSVNSEFYSFLQNKSLNHTHTDLYTIYCVYSVHIYVVCLYIFIPYKNRTHFSCRRSFDKTANDPRWGRMKRKAGTCHCLCIIYIYIHIFVCIRIQIQKKYFKGCALRVKM